MGEPSQAVLEIDVLYAEHAGALARYLDRLTGAGAHVDDLLQECFIVAFQRRADYAAERGTTGAWLYGIATNVARHYLRSRRRRERFELRLLAQPTAAPPRAPDDAAELRRGLRHLRDAIAALPLEQREVFVLYELEGLDGASIARVTGVPENTVWTRLHRARRAFEKRLRRRLGQEVQP